MSHRRNALIRLGLRSITAGFFFLAALLLLSRHTATLSWQTVAGTVDEVAIEAVGDPGDSRAPGERFRPAVSYRYTLNSESSGDREYTASAIAVYPWIFADRDRVVAYLERHGIRRGARIPVHYNPDDPADAILVRDIPWRRLEVILAFLFLVLLPAAVVFTSILDFIRGSRRPEDRSRGRFW